MTGAKPHAWTAVGGGRSVETWAGGPATTRVSTV